MKAVNLLTMMGGIPPQWGNILAWYRGEIADGKLLAYRPRTTSTTPQVKGSAFTGAGTGAAGVTTAMTFTADGPSDPVCTVNGTLTIPGDCWNIRAYLDDVLFAFWPGINIGGSFELDASGNGHTLYLTDTSITERLDGTGTDYKNESGFASCIAVPDGFTWPAALPTINIHVDDSGVASAPGYDISAERPTGKAYYVKPTGGSDANDGMTWATALAKINTAILKADVKVVYVQAGEFGRTSSWQGAEAASDISVIAVGGTVVSKYYDTFSSWTPDATYPTVSKVARSATVQVRDVLVPDADGDPSPLTLRASVEEVSLNPGSWYTDNVSVWVLPSDSRAADTNLWVILTGNNGRVNGKSIYVEGFEFRGGGGFRAINENAGGYTTVKLKNCTMKYTAPVYAGGVSVLGNVALIAENCISEKNTVDGFNYHIQGIQVPVAVEINCTSKNNGFSGGDDTYNGSSMHDTGTIIRIGGSYHDNYGPNIADVLLSNSWNIGVSAADSLAVTNNHDFQVSGGGMWLHSCTGGSFAALLSADMYAYDTTTTGATSTPYTPTAGLSIPIVYGGPIATPGPLSRDATVVSGTWPNVVIKAPLGPEFQGIAEATNNADINLGTRANTDYIVNGPGGALFYSQALSAADKIRAEKYVA